jgi:nucleoid-associated protein YgaU
MTKNIIFVLAVVLTAGIVFSSTAVFAAERMTYEEYQKKIEALQARETAARSALEAENAAIADLKARIADLEAQIAAVWDDLYASMGITRDQIKEFDAQLDAIESHVNELARLAPEQLLARAAELDAIAVKLDEFALNPIAKLPEQRNRIAQISGRVDALKASLPKPKHDLYTVLRGDCLWRISGKKDTYGDPWKWLRLWSYNRTIIKDPDLIYPAQQLTVPRQLSKDEYLVQRGDNLKKIAGKSEVFGDPFQWTKLYQANKSGQFLSDPNKLYPEQILTIPRN